MRFVLIEIKRIMRNLINTCADVNLGILFQTLGIDTDTAKPVYASDPSPRSSLITVFQDFQRLSKAVFQIGFSTLYEPRHVKTSVLAYAKNKDADQLRGNRETDQRLCFRYMDSTIPLLPKSEISSL